MNEVISTIIVSLILLAITSLIIIKRIKARKEGCGCGCGNCSKASSCNSIKEFFASYKAKKN
jgi:hypothetical protein